MSVDRVIVEAHLGPATDGQFRDGISPSGVRTVEHVEPAWYFLAVQFERRWFVVPLDVIGVDGALQLIGGNKARIDAIKRESASTGEFKVDPLLLGIAGIIFFREFLATRDYFFGNVYYS